MGIGAIELLGGLIVLILVLLLIVIRMPRKQELNDEDGESGEVVEERILSIFSRTEQVKKERYSPVEIAELHGVLFPNKREIDPFDAYWRLDSLAEKGRLACSETRSGAGKDLVCIMLYSLPSS